MKRSLCFVGILIAVLGVCSANKIQCSSSNYPPAAETVVTKVVVDLDLPPEQRWNELVKVKKNEIVALCNAFVDLVKGVFNGAILTLVNTLGPYIHSTLPSPYKEEIKSIADQTGLDLGIVLLYNVFYEFFTVCTSIVAENEQGQIYHARNLDFGLFLGWNTTSHTWSVTEILRKNVVQVEWRRGNKTLFHSVNFAGYIGVVTAMKPNQLSFSIDERFNRNGGFIGLYQWLIQHRHDLQWIGFLGREVFEQDLDFAQANDFISKAKLIAPAYFIVGGNKTGEGVILTKDRNVDSADVYTMKANGEKYGDWYVLETNYDHWEEPPFYDDRRTSGHFCMRQMGKEKVSFDGIFNVLSTQPNLNKLTAYTALMSVNTNEFETYLQRCEGDCSPW